MTGLILYRSIQRPLHGVVKQRFFSLLLLNHSEFLEPHCRDRIGEDIRKISACRKPSNSNAENPVM